MSAEPVPVRPEEAGQYLMCGPGFRSYNTSAGLVFRGQII